MQQLALLAPPKSPGAVEVAHESHQGVAGGNKAPNKAPASVTFARALSTKALPCPLSRAPSTSSAQKLCSLGCPLPVEQWREQGHG